MRVYCICNEIYSTFTAKKPGTEANDFLDFGDDEKTIEEIKMAQDQKFDLNRPSRNNAKDGKKTKGKAAAQGKEKKFEFSGDDGLQW